MQVLERLQEEPWAPDYAGQYLPDQRHQDVVRGHDLQRIQSHHPHGDGRRCAHKRWRHKPLRSVLLVSSWMPSSECNFVFVFNPCLGAAAGMNWPSCFLPTNQTVTALLTDRDPALPTFQIVTAAENVRICPADGQRRRYVLRFNEVITSQPSTGSAAQSEQWRLKPDPTDANSESL